jgi:hypothetical protein
MVFRFDADFQGVRHVHPFGDAARLHRAGRLETGRSCSPSRTVTCINRHSESASEGTRLDAHQTEFASQFETDYRRSPIMNVSLWSPPARRVSERNVMTRTTASPAGLSPITTAVADGSTNAHATLPIGKSIAGALGAQSDVGLGPSHGRGPWTRISGGFTLTSDCSRLSSIGLIELDVDRRDNGNFSRSTSTSASSVRAVSDVARR